MAQRSKTIDRNTLLLRPQICATGWSKMT